jgi:hypothetical protein
MNALLLQAMPREACPVHPHPTPALCQYRGKPFSHLVTVPREAHAVHCVVVAVSVHQALIGCLWSTIRDLFEGTLRLRVGAWMALAVLGTQVRYGLAGRDRHMSWKAHLLQVDEAPFLQHGEHSFDAAGQALGKFFFQSQHN